MKGIKVITIYGVRYCLLPSMACQKRYTTRGLLPRLSDLGTAVGKYQCKPSPHSVKQLAYTLPQCDSLNKQTKRMYQMKGQKPGVTKECNVWSWAG